MANQDWSQPDGESKGSWIIALVFGAVILGAALFTFFGPQPVTSADIVTLGTGEDSACDLVANLAIEASDENCRQIGGNQVCYGNDTIEAGLAEGATDPFDMPGDVVAVDQVTDLFTAPLDPEFDEWGIAIFKLLADLEGTVPGQFVTILVTGNTSLENTSGDMQAFYFTSGLGRSRCESIPFEGVVIDVPDGAEVAFEANGTRVSLSGIAALTAEAGRDMNVSLFSGRASVTADGQVQELELGQSVAIPLGEGANGREPTGPPSAPAEIELGTQSMGCLTTGSGCTPEQELARAARAAQQSASSSGTQSGSTASNDGESGASSSGSSGQTGGLELPAFLQPSSGGEERRLKLPAFLQRPSGGGEREPLFPALTGDSDSQFPEGTSGEEGEGEILAVAGEAASRIVLAVIVVVLFLAVLIVLVVVNDGVRQRRRAAEASSDKYIDTFGFEEDDN